MLKDSARPSPSVVSVLVSLGALVTLAVACGPGNVASSLAKPPEVTPNDPTKSSPTLAPQGEVAGMVSIPAGSFMMGSNDGEADETPVHRVSVAGFAMDVTEVTTAAYTACVRAVRCSAAGTDTYCNYGHSDKNNHPINCVDWDQATAYCASVGKRLPTEEEWEYAARGTDGRKYSWGNEEPGTRACWNRAPARRHPLELSEPVPRWSNKEGTCSVSSYPSGVFGLKDMNGNVWEWTSSGSSDDYNKNRTNIARVFRGGSWFLGVASDLRSSSRNRYAPSDRNGILGVRCAR